MPLPGNVSTVTVHGQYINSVGNPATGTVVITQPNFLRDPGANVVIAPGGGTATLSGSGEFTMVLVASDDPDLDPIGFTYRVTETINGLTRTYDMLLPAATPTVELADIAPAPPAGGVAWSYVPLTEKGVANGVATLDATGKVPALQLPAGTGSGYATVQDAGVVLTQRAVMNFVGTGVTATDDAANSRTNVTIPTGHTIQDEGSGLSSRAGLNFVGAGVTVTDDSGNDRTNVTIPSGSGTGHTIQDEGGALATRTGLNFIGSGVTVSDDSANSRTNVTIPGVGVDVHNVLNYGALGNSHHSTGGGQDDTTFIQAAVDAARNAGGRSIVVFPGYKTYRITSTINISTGTQSAVQMVGMGSFNGAGISGMPTIVWDGAEDGVMFYVGTTVGNIAGSLFSNLNIRGKGGVIDSTVGLPRHGILYWPETGASGTPGSTGTPGTNGGKHDSGSGLDNVWFQRIKGNAVHSAVMGATNWWIRGGRWDQVHGYGLYFRVASQSILSIRDVTWDNWGASFPGHGLGMVHFDAAGGGATAFVFCHFDTVHPETNADLREANSGGTNPADRSGVIHCTIDSTQGLMQHNLLIDNTVLQGGSTKSRSMVLALGGAGATEALRETQRKNRITIVGRNLRGFNGDGTAATGHVIPIGGVPSADKSPYITGFYPVLEWSPGATGDGTFGSELGKFWRRNAAGNSNTNS